MDNTNMLTSWHMCGMSFFSNNLTVLPLLSSTTPTVSISAFLSAFFLYCPYTFPTFTTFFLQALISEKCSIMQHQSHYLTKAGHILNHPKFLLTQPSINLYLCTCLQLVILFRLASLTSRYTPALMNFMFASRSIS